MSMWDIYRYRIESRGETKRDSMLNRERRFLATKSGDNLSYNHVLIDGEKNDVMIIATDNLNEKFIYAVSGGDIPCGSLVEWMGYFWLVTEKDAATELYVRAKMVQCNYLLKWVESDGTILEQWCVIEDGTKYLTGTYQDRDFFISRGDSRLGMTIAKNEHTERLKRGCRFLIDDANSDTMLAYELTKPFKLSGVYNEVGVYKFVLQEVNTTANDNQELGIADYYKVFDKETGEKIDSTSGTNGAPSESDSGRWF